VHDDIIIIAADAMTMMSCVLGQWQWPEYYEYMNTVVTLCTRFYVLTTSLKTA